MKSKIRKVIYLHFRKTGILKYGRLSEKNKLGSYHHTNANMLRIIQGAKFVKKPANNMLPIIRPRFKIHKLKESEKEKLSVSSRIVLPRLQRKTL